jgi:hypothetical protein
MRRRLLLLLAASFLLVGSSLVVDPAHADPAASIDDSGWWWRAQTNPTVMLPPPPNVEKGQLLVQSGPEGAIALAAVAGTLVEGQAGPVLTLKVAEGGDADAGAVIVACQAGAAWKGGDAQVWSEHPPAGCEAGGVKGTPSEDGTSWSFDVGTLQFGAQVNVVIAPGTVEGQPEGANYPTFSVTFEKPSVESLATTPGAAPAPPTVGSIDVGGDPTIGAGVSSYESPPVDTGSLDLPSVVAAVPGEDQSLTPVAPSTQSQQPLLPASVLVDPRSPHARSVGVVLLLLGGALVYFMTRQQQVIGPEGVPGGLGRWAAPRWGTPPSLRG